MGIVAFITVVAVLIFASRMKELKDAREAIAAAGGISSKYQCMDFSKGPKIAYIVLSILGIISGIYGYTIQDYTTVALGVLIFFLFLAEFFMANIQYKFYYSSTAFINRGKVVRYKSIKDFEKKKMPMAFVAVITYSGDKHLVPPKALNLIKEQMQKKEK